MQLNHLHNDALFGIVALLPDRTLVDFALTCRRLWELSRSDLKQRQYAKLYSTIRLISSSTYHNADWKHPIELIAKLREDAHISAYVKVLEFSPPFPKSWNSKSEEQYDQFIKNLIKSMNYLEDDIDAFTFLTVEEKRAWKEEVREFNPNPCFLVLLSLCKNVKELALCDPYDLPDYSDSVVDQMRVEHNAAKTGRNNEALERFFPSLTTLELSHWDTENGLTSEDVFPMLQIPGIRDFHGYMLGHEWEPEDWIWPVNLTGCKIENVSLVAGTLQPTALINFMRGLPNLKTLTFHERWEFQDVGDSHNDWDNVEQYVEILKQNGDTFFQARSLHVSFQQNMWTDRNSIRTFGAIDVVRIQKIVSNG